MPTFFTADTHFGHARMADPTFGGYRGFSTIAEHDEALIANWNAVVGQDDVVWHLGDFAYRCSPPRAREIFRRLNGTKHLVRGNHDGDAVERLEWASKHDFLQTNVDATHVVLFHYGMRVWPGSRRNAIHLYGHSHGRLQGFSSTCDVGVDAWGYRPVTLDDIKRRLATLPEMHPEEEPEETSTPTPR